MTLITSERGATRFLSIRWPLSPRILCPSGRYLGEGAAGDAAGRGQLGRRSVAGKPELGWPGPARRRSLQQVGARALANGLYMCTAMPGPCGSNSAHVLLADHTPTSSLRPITQLTTTTNLS